MNQPRSTLVADDHLLLGEAVAQILTLEGDFTVTVASNLQETLEAIAVQPFDIILLDVMMPGMDGLASVNRVMKLAPQARVVLFSGNIAADFAHKAVSDGAAGFIPKTMPLKSLPAALRLVDSGLVFMPVLPSDKGEVAPRIALTSMQVEMLKLVQAGRTNKEIARILSGTETGVKMHLRTIFAKLKAKNRAHAVALAQASGIL